MQSASHKEMEKAISKKSFLITLTQRIKALFLKEEARKNFSVWSFALGMFCAAWLYFISDCCSSPTLGGGAVSSGKLAVVVVFFLKAELLPALLLKSYLERHEQIKGVVKTKAVFSPHRQLKHHK